MHPALPLDRVSRFDRPDLDRILDWLEGVDNVGNGSYFDLERLGGVPAHFRNPQAEDLGWYAHVGYTTAYDEDDEVIARWVKQIMQEVDLWQPLDFYEEGMTLFGMTLGIPPVEVSGIRFTESELPEHTEYTDEQHERILRLTKASLRTRRPRRPSARSVLAGKGWTRPDGHYSVDSKIAMRRLPVTA